MALMKKKRLKIIIAILFLVLAAAAAYSLFSVAEEELDPPPSVSQLTGANIGPDVAKRPILGIMIENSEAARPQTGLDSAGIVFEAVTEGGITRYLALYQEDIPEIAGPVRSLRAHFLDWSMGYDSSVAHVGGNEVALKQAESRNAKSLNQFNHEKEYYRSDDRVAPHNVYTRTGLLRDLQKELNHKTSDFKEIPRSSDTPSQTPQAPEINIDFSSPQFKVQFRYDATTNSYTRLLAGEPHIDSATNKPITVKNVIVIKMPNGNTAQEGALGKGAAYVFKDGNVTAGTWQQTSFKNRIVIEDIQGVEIPLNRGDSWFAALTEGRALVY